MELSTSAKLQFEKLKSRFWSSETTIMVVFAVIVGLGAGLGAIFFIEMIAFFRNIFFEQGKLLGLPGGTYVILLPLVGGLIVGPLVHFIAPEAKGHGVPEVLTAILTRGGKIRPVVVLAKAICSAITIGSGGSVGREGPIVQIGAALGSTIGQLFKLNERRVINLVASGAAAGIAATFNAPIAGVMFAMEVILGDFGFHSLSTMVISAVTASVVSRAVLGDSPSFIVPSYALNSYWELLFYIVLGVLAGLVGLLFVRILYFMEDFFDHWKFPAYLKPAVGGLALGVLGYFLPQIFGTGFDTIADTLNGKIGLGLLVILVFGKILATTLTLGSGASGGVFAPALFIGAVLGGAFGQTAQLIFPGIPASSGAYAMVGMAAVFAAAARAPITAVIILFEMTQDYRIILPLMFATVISTILAQHMEPESIYTLKLTRRGLDVRARKNDNLMGGIMVAEAMTPIDEYSSISFNTPGAELASLFQETSHQGCVVLDDRNELYGMVTISDLETIIGKKQTHLPVKDFCTHKVLTLFPDETLDDAVRHIGILDVGRIPVVDRTNPRHVLGVLRRSDIVHALSNALVNKHQKVHRINRLRMEAEVGSELVEINISKDDAVVGKKLNEFKLPENCVIVSIQRGMKLVIPRGNTQLLADDRLIMLTGEGTVETLKKVFKTTPA